MLPSPSSTKKWLFLILLPAVAFLNSSALLASHKGEKTVIYGDTSYDFKAFYKLHTPSSPSDLLVELIAQYNLCYSSSPSEFWVPGMYRLDLRFSLDGTEKRIKIWKEGTKKYKIVGLDTIASSVWYPAIKLLIEDLGAQYYGTSKEKKTIISKNALKKSLPLINIKPLKNCKLRTIGDVSRQSPHSLSKVLSVTMIIEPEMYLGKEVIIAKAVFRTKKLITFQEPYTTIKFVVTKHGLKEISRHSFKCSSAWYPSIKKIAQNSLHQYFQFKSYHKHVLRKIKAKKRASRLSHLTQIS